MGRHQKGIIDSADARRNPSVSPELLYALALIVAVAALIPWTWYLLLRRLREVRDALTGR